MSRLPGTLFGRGGLARSLERSISSLCNFYNTLNPATSLTPSAVTRSSPAVNSTVTTVTAVGIPKNGYYLL